MAPRLMQGSEILMNLADGCLTLFSTALSLQQLIASSFIQHCTWDKKPRKHLKKLKRRKKKRKREKKKGKAETRKYNKARKYRKKLLVSVDMLKTKFF